MATWTVTYIARGETEQKTAIVKIAQNSPATFYATNLELWGCGKDAYSPAWAIKSLIQDMATIIDMQPNMDY